MIADLCTSGQAPNAAARQQVQSRTPQLPPPRGRIQLDDEPDVREVRAFPLSMQLGHIIYTSDQRALTEAAAVIPTCWLIACRCC